MKKPKPLAKRLTQTLLRSLQKRKITNLQAAEKLGVSETYLSRTVAKLQTKVPGTEIPRREAASKLIQARRQARATLGKLVAKGKLSAEEAAEQANCSLRTMQRYAATYSK